MTDEDRNRTVEFILEQQARVTVDLQQLAEANVAAEKRIARLESALVTVVSMIGESNQRTDARIAEINEKHVEINEKHAETNERLDHFIYVLEKYISERQNGKNSQT
ncbi:MAG: hypothetical protein ACREEM_27380 [Blastocatellia bacterium]